MIGVMLLASKQEGLSQDFNFAIMSGNVEKVSEYIQKSPELVNQKIHGGDSPLHYAAEFGNIALAEQLLTNNADINARGVNGWTPLHRAVMSGDTNMAAFLLKHKADVNARGYDGDAPLYRAIGSANMVRLLLANGADINAEDKWHNTVLSGAVRGARNIGADIIPLLLANGANANALDLDSETPLYQAVLENNKTVVELLLPYYTSTEARKRLGTSLSLAADKSNGELALMILTARFRFETNLFLKAVAEGDDVYLQSQLTAHPTSINDTGVFGWTPLHIATQFGQAAAAETLLANQANPNLKDDLGHSPMQWAALLGRSNMVEILLRHGADVNANGCNGYSPIDFAVQQGFNSVVVTLLANGANINTGRQFGRTPLHLAVMDGNIEAMKQLLLHGANVNVLDGGKIAPLDFAVMRDSPEEVGLLLTNRASIHTQMREGGTTLFHVWAEKGNSLVANQLLAAGCDVNAKDRDGKTPLFDAVQREKTTAVEWLLDHTADVNAKDSSGKTVLLLLRETRQKWARHMGFDAESESKKIEKILLDHGATE